MKKAFSQYPGLIYRLALVVFLAQFAYTYIPLSGSVEYAPFWQNFTLRMVMDGIAAMVAGWLAGKAQDVRTGMMSGISVMILGYVLLNFTLPAAQVAGAVLVECGITAFFVLCLLNVSVLFPVATDWKDNAFVMIFLAWWLPTPLITVVYQLFTYLENERLSTFFTPVVAMIAIGLLTQFKDIGFKVEDEENDEAEEEPPRWNVLIGVTLAVIVFQWAGVTFNSIARGERFYLGFEYEILGWIALLMLLLLFLFVYFQLQAAQSKPRQFGKIMASLSIMLGVGFLKLLVRQNGSHELDFFVNIVSAVLPVVVVFPVLVSVLTHVNFDRQAGLWLGIFLGAPHIFLALCDVLFAGFNFWVATLISAVLVVLALIFLWENKSLILSRLKLDEANQEVEEPKAESDDPMEHLVE